MSEIESHPLEKILHQRIAVMDGAMGTMIQQYKLSEADYRGERFRDWKGKDLKGSLELLLLTKPDVVREIPERSVIRKLRFPGALMESASRMIASNAPTVRLSVTGWPLLTSGACVPLIR